MPATMYGCKYHFCEQVFISEQILYNKQDLERHQRQGDLTGPLAESGFKGHPNCRCATWHIARSWETKQCALPPDMTECCPAASTVWICLADCRCSRLHGRFCRKRVYGDNELFQHMQQGHEQCFLCRKARPDKFVYYRDYRELEGQHPHKPLCRILEQQPFAGVYSCAHDHLQP